MMNVTRLSSRTLRTRVPFAARASPQLRRYAQGSYGNEQSGQEQGLHEVNPKRHLEHPGPDSPATQASSDKSSSSNSGSDSHKAEPKIHAPKSAAENSNPEVEKHNEEMRNRADKTVNQIGEEDSKVDKKFWQGDVGDMKEK